ncbi:MAG: hypothetical protein SF028_11170 [Candidatus Sumerlaeia bacterium]|nr:hypothetical protein [Candidatus Sumerlaeia bacterium]
MSLERSTTRRLAPLDTSWFVVLVPERVEYAGMQVDFLAAVLELDRYSARARLAAAAPQILRRSRSEAPAVELARKLSEHGLRAHVLSEPRLAEMQPEEVKSLAPGKGALGLTLADSRTESVKVSDIAGLARAELEERILRESRREDPLIGQIDADREVERSARTHVFDLHLASSPRLYRIVADRFDFRSLFGDKPVHAATPAAVAKLWEWLGKCAPAAERHEEFLAARGYLAESRELLAQCSSLHEWGMSRPLLSRLALDRTKRFRESDLPAFTLYSALCRFTTLERRRG